jgi:CheY-like chemotaxis protein
MNEKVLVVDDNPAVLEVARRVLANSEYQVITAGTGEEGILLAKRDRPSLILLDIDLPGADGGDVARALGDIPATADIPIIFVSGLVTIKDETPMGSGGRPLLAKPFERPKLLETVRRYMRAFEPQR